MYHNRFVCAIRVNGKILREDNGTVAIPFGSEYEIRLKNLNSVKAQVRVSIDGEEATDWLVMSPNSTLDLEGFLRKGNLKVGNRFKFIERTANIEKHRGIEAEDGLVRVEYKFEKPSVRITSYPVIHEHHYYRPWWDYTYYTCGGIHGNGVVWTLNNSGIGADSNAQVTYTSNLGESTSGSIGSAQNSCFAMNCSMDPTPTEPSSFRSASLNEVGITVPGSESNQQFHTTYDFACEDSEVIVLRLVGKLKDKPVSRPITVDIKPTCVTCGRVNKAHSKFCSECGTALVIK